MPAPPYLLIGWKDVTSIEVGAMNENIYGIPCDGDDEEVMDTPLEFKASLHCDELSLSLMTKNNND